MFGDWFKSRRVLVNKILAQAEDIRQLKAEQEETLRDYGQMHREYVSVCGKLQDAEKRIVHTENLLGTSEAFRNKEAREVESLRQELSVYQQDYTRY